MRQFVQPRHGVRLFRGNADRERANQREVAGAVHRKALPLDARFQRPVHGVQKVVAVRLYVKSDQVGAQQSVEQFALPGQIPKASGLGQGMCQKIATRASGRSALIIAGSSAKW